MIISSAFAQAAPSGDPGYIGLLPIVLMFVLLYFLMIRPQMKRAKETKAMIEALQKGDEVVTAGGIVGRISKMGNPTLRTLLILGATTVLRHARNGGKASPWLQAILSRRPPKVAAVALTNKTARIVWALLIKQEDYKAPVAATA